MSGLEWIHLGLVEREDGYKSKFLLGNSEVDDPASISICLVLAFLKRGFGVWQCASDLLQGPRASDIAE